MSFYQTSLANTKNEIEFDRVRERDMKKERRKERNVLDSMMKHIHC